MQANFRPNGSQEVVVSNQINGVLVEVYESDAGPHLNGLVLGNIRVREDVLIHIEGIPFTLRAGAIIQGTPENWALAAPIQSKFGQPDERKQTLLSLSRADARSIASAIMGAASKQD